MTTISLQCNGLSQCLLQAENTMTGREVIALTAAYLERLLINSGATCK